MKAKIRDIFRGSASFATFLHFVIHAAALALLSACSTLTPVRLDAPAHLRGVQSRTQDGVTVSVAMLTDEQARQHFGAELERHAIQVAWISVRNTSDRDLWFIRNMLDPDFYSADEVAFMVCGDAGRKGFDALRQRLRDESIRVLMKPAMVTEGYMFLPMVEGGRFFDFSLQGDAWYEGALVPGEAAHPRELRFGFAMAMPDGEFDYERLDPDQIYAGRSLPDLDAGDLRRELEAVRCCTTDREGVNDGDPLNIGLIGEVADLLNALTRSGWSFTHRITAHTVIREIGAALTGAAYTVAPVSNLYVFGRAHDIALQRARRTIVQRNHMRLWLAPFRFQGQHVWVGQVSRDIGVKVTTKSPTLTTHVIDPEVDATREYLLHSLLAQRLVERFGFVKGSALAPRDAPRRNLTDDPFFSDGMRLVVVLRREPIAVHEIRDFMWERAAAPIAEGQSDAALRNVRPLVPAGQ
jgi:hypothetical protein